MKQIKTYLVSIASLYECASLDKYIESLENIAPSIDNFISVEFPQYISDVYPLARYIETIVVRIKNESKYPGNLFRFAFFPMGLDKDDFCIFTDTHDVFFQKELPELDKTKIYVAPEHLKWNESDFWMPILNQYGCRELDGFPIYCMGSWAMPISEVNDLLEFMIKNSARFNYANFSDQILFNLWLKNKKFEIHPTLFATIFNGYNLGKISIKDKKVLSDKGEEFSIVHFNGNTKQYYDFF
jgi:hypothetical protein